MSKERIEYLAETETSLEQLLESIPEMRFPKGTWYKTKLHKSLEQAGLLHLEHDCLLSKDVQANHATHLYQKTRNKFKNIRQFSGISADDLHENFRFITILDSVVPLNHDDALSKINEFRDELVKLFKKFSRPLKKCSSNAPGSWISKKRIAQTGLRSDWSGHFGLFAGRFARSGRTYPMVHA